MLRPTPITIALLFTLSGLTAQMALERPVPYPVFESKKFARAIEAGTRTRDGKPGPKMWRDACSYRIEATLDPKARRLEGKATMKFTNTSPRALRRLVVHLRQNLHKEGSFRNTAVEITGGVELNRLALDGEEVAKRRYSLNSTVLSVRLPSRLRTGKSVTLEIEWAFKVPAAGRAPRMGHEDGRVYFLGYWYPQFAVLDDVEGWVADPYMGRGEFYMPYGDYDVSLTLPAGWLVHATGALQNPKEVLTDAQLEGLEKARTSREIVHLVTEEDLEQGTVTRASEADLTWRFRADQVRDFAISVSDRYLWDATHAEIPGRDEVSMIHTVYEKNASGWRKNAADYARHSIEFVSKELTPYPWPHMTVCEGIVGGGMEFPMMTDVGVPGIASLLHGVIAHELIHMWFPMIVGTNEKAWAWMDEGLTSFLTALAAHSYFEKESALKRPRIEYVAQAKRGAASVMMNHADHYPPRVGGGMGFASYSKPSAVFHQLMNTMGKEEFFACLRAYVDRWAGLHPYPHDLFNTFRDVSGQDLDWYFRTWMYESWTLDTAVKSVSVGEEGSEVIVEDLGLAAGPTVVEATFADGKTERKTVAVKHWLSGKRTAKVVFGGSVRRVVIDPDEISLDVDRGNNEWKPREL